MDSHFSLSLKHIINTHLRKIQTKFLLSGKNDPFFIYFPFYCVTPHSQWNNYSLITTHNSFSKMTHPKLISRPRTLSQILRSLSYVFREIKKNTRIFLLCANTLTIIAFYQRGYRLLIRNRLKFPSVYKPESILGSSV